MTVNKESRIIELFSKPFVVVPLLLFFVAVSYANTLYSPFVLDDIHSFIEEPNVYIKDLSYASFNKLSETVFGKARFIPLATFSLNHYIANGGITVYHITNIIIHLLVTLAVYWFAKNLLRTPVGSKSLRDISGNYFCFFVAALWALNPVQTNAVTYVVQRMTSISTLFYLATLTLYIKGRLITSRRHKIIYYSSSLVSALGAFYSKENSYTLPAAVFLIEWIFISPDFIVKSLRRIKWHHWIWVILTVIVIMPLLEHKWAAYTVGFQGRPFSLSERLYTETRIVIHYISLLILPVPGRMNFDYDFPLSISILTPPATILAILILSAVIFGAFNRRRRYPFFAFGVFWFFLNLAIESTVIPLELIFEHRLYLSSIGFYMAFLSLLDLLVASIKTRHSNIEVEQFFVLLMVFVVTLFSIGTTIRNHAWRDSYALYGDSVRKSPNKPRTHLNFGLAMGRDRNLERESIEEFEKVIELGKPQQEEYILALNNMVVSYANLGEYDEAIAQGENRLKNAPDYVSGKGYPHLMSNLAYVYNKKGNYSEAMRLLVSGMTAESIRMNGYLVDLMSATLSLAYDDEEYRKKLELTEENGNKFLSVRLRMARLLADLRDYEKADHFLRPVMESFPEHEYAGNLHDKIQAQLEKNRKQSELMNIKNYPPYNEKIIYRLSMDLSAFIIEYYPPLYSSVGWLLDKAEKVSQADDPFVLWYRIKWYMKTGQLDMLAQALEKAVVVQPDFIHLLKLAGDYYELIGEQAKAIEIFTHILDIYPADPAWLMYQKRIAAYNEENNINRQL